jgi:hypothetical protein
MENDFDKRIEALESQILLNGQEFRKLLNNYQILIQANNSLEALNRDLTNRLNSILRSKKWKLVKVLSSLFRIFRL